MSSPVGVRLPHRTLPGAAQMALDAALLQWAASSGGRLAVRTYSWARPTLSLGRSEPFPSGWNRAAIEAAGIDVVRRPTGGDAVLHDDEVTVAAVASLPGPWANRPRAFAGRVALAIADALGERGIPATVVGSGEEALRAGPAGARPCFARAAAGEVRVGAFKAVGIASRFTRGAVLSHASIPLSARHRDIASLREDAERAEEGLRAHASSLGEILARPVRAEEIEGPLLAALERRLGARIEEAPFPFDLALDAAPLAV